MQSCLLKKIMHSYFLVAAKIMIVRSCKFNIKFSLFCTALMHLEISKNHLDKRKLHQVSRFKNVMEESTEKIVACHAEIVWGQRNVIILMEHV